jgi:hypothetical protein
MSKQRGRGGMGSHKHGVSGRAGPPRAAKWATAQFFNKEAARRKARKKDVWFGARSAQSKETEITCEKHAATVVGYVSRELSRPIPASKIRGLYPTNP